MLRIPGTTNWKYAPARKVELRLIDTTRKYAVAEIEGLIVSKSSTREAAVRTQPRPTNSQISAYAQKAFDEEIARVRSATEGERNDTLNRASFSLGQLIASGELPDEMVRRALLDAALGAGLGEREARSTVESGLAAGAGEPRTVPAQEEERVSVDWADLDLSIVNGSRRPAPRFPLRIFGPYWSDWIGQHAEACSAPVDYVAAALLSEASALIGNSRWVMAWPGWNEPPILWLANVGNPSSGKSPAQDAVVNLLRTLEDELAADYPDQLRQWRTDKLAAKVEHEDWETKLRHAIKQGQPLPTQPAAAVEPEKPVRPRIRVSDTTPEALGRLLAVLPRGLLLHRDELAGWLGNFDKYGGAGGERAFWLEAFGGRSHVIDRVKQDGEPIIILRVSVSILGGLQPDRLAKALLAGDDDGLAARFDFIWPDPVFPGRPRRSLNDTPALIGLRRVLDLQMGSDAQGLPAPILVPLENDAADLFQEWRVRNAAREQGASGMFLSYLGKLPGRALRYSLVLRHLRWCVETPATPAPMSISKDVLANVLLLLDEYLIPMAERAFGDAALPEAERNSVAVAKAILAGRLGEKDEAGRLKVNVRATTRKRLPGLRESAKVRAAFQVLVEADWLRVARTREGARPGREREDCEVNPAVFKLGVLISTPTTKATLGADSPVQGSANNQSAPNGPIVTRGGSPMRTQDSSLGDSACGEDDDGDKF